MTKYKYSQKRLAKAIREVTSLQLDIIAKEYIINDLLATIPEPEKGQNPSWTGHVSRTGAISPSSTPSKPLKKIEQLKGDYPPYVLSDKLKEVIDRLNLLSEKL